MLLKKVMNVRPAQQNLHKRKTTRSCQRLPTVLTQVSLPLCTLLLSCSSTSSPANISNVSKDKKNSFNLNLRNFRTQNVFKVDDRPYTSKIIVNATKVKDHIIYMNQKKIGLTRILYEMFSYEFLLKSQIFCWYIGRSQHITHSMFA